MPIYTYRCENCGVQFERQLKFSDPHPTRCPECTLETLRRVYLPVGIVFKGSGFYATDHRSPSGQNSRGSKTGEAETKPAAAEGASGTPSPATPSSTPSAE